MIVGTRGSRLALIQTDIAIRNLGIDGEIRTVKTRGDKSQKELKDLGGRAFTCELDEALLKDEIDLALHSMKDIPVEDFPDELEIACVVERADPHDCLVSNRGRLEDLPEGAVVGASSERRKVELLTIRGDLEIKPLRGNVPTRVGKLDAGEYDAIVTAKCALQRLGFVARIAQIFEVNEMVPAACQGAIAVVMRKDYEFRIPDKLKINLAPCMMERLFISGLGACRNPVGAYCSHNGEELTLTGLYYADGMRLSPEFKGSINEIKHMVERWKDEYT